MTAHAQRCVCAVALFVLASACTTTQQPSVVLSTKSPVELRVIQSRAFETDDRPKVYRAVLGTLQDMGYSISKVEPSAGTVTADKLAMLELTATVYPRGTTRMIVRANATVKIGPQVSQGHQVDSAEFYQQLFFEPLSKSLFLTALHVEDSEIQQMEADLQASDGNNDESETAPVETEGASTN